MSLKISIAHLYPKLLNLYGDRGNVITLIKRCEWRGIEVEFDEINTGDSIKEHDLYFIGGGQDKQQIEVAGELYRQKNNLTDQRDKGTVFLGICGGGAVPVSRAQRAVGFRRALGGDCPRNAAYRRLAASVDQLADLREAESDQLAGTAVRRAFRRRERMGREAAGRPGGTGRALRDAAAGQEALRSSNCAAGGMDAAEQLRLSLLVPECRRSRGHRGACFDGSGRGTVSSAGGTRRILEFPRILFDLFLRCSGRRHSGAGDAVCRTGPAPCRGGALEALSGNFSGGRLPADRRRIPGSVPCCRGAAAGFFAGTAAGERIDRHSADAAGRFSPSGDRVDPGEAGFRIPLSSAAVSAAVVSADRRGHRRSGAELEGPFRHAARAADGGAAAFCILSVSFAAPLVQCAAAAPVLHTARRGRSFRPGGGGEVESFHLAADAFSGDYRRFARGGKSGGDSALVSVCPLQAPVAAAGWASGCGGAHFVCNDVGQPFRRHAGAADRNAVPVRGSIAGGGDSDRGTV